MRPQLTFNFDKLLILVTHISPMWPSWEMTHFSWLARKSSYFLWLTCLKKAMLTYEVAYSLWLTWAPNVLLEKVHDSRTRKVIFWQKQDTLVTQKNIHVAHQPYWYRSSPLGNQVSQLHRLSPSSLPAVSNWNPLCCRFQTPPNQIHIDHKNDTNHN